MGQKRVPAGSSNGGQFARGGGGSALNYNESRAAEGYGPNRGSTDPTVREFQGLIAPRSPREAKGYQRPLGESATGGPPRSGSVTLDSGRKVTEIARDAPRFNAQGHLNFAGEQRFSYELDGKSISERGLVSKLSATEIADLKVKARAKKAAEKPLPPVKQKRPKVTTHLFQSGHVRDLD